MWASYHGHLDVVKILIAAGGMRSHHCICTLLHNTKYCFLIGTEYNKEMMMWILTFVFPTGANVNHVNEGDSAALSWAADKGHLDVVKTLIAAGKIKTRNCIAILLRKPNYVYPIDITGSIELMMAQYYNCSLLQGQMWSRKRKMVSQPWCGHLSKIIWIFWRLWLWQVR